MLKCPYCGADIIRCTLDVDIIVTCDIDENGTYALRPYHNYSDINRIVHEQPTEKELTMFCCDCGAYVPVKLFDDGHIEPYKQEE